MIDGVVTDTNLVPLANATAQVLGSTVTVATGANGRFRIAELPEGEHVLAVRRIGYVQLVTLVTVAAGDTTRPSFALEPFEQLNPVVVKARPASVWLAGFESRKAAGFGHFLDRAQIDSLKKSFATDLLQQFSQFVKVTSGPMGGGVYNRRGGIAAGGLANPCAFEIFIDGMPQPVPFDATNLPRPSDLAGVELYPGAATVPLEFKRLSGGAMCGVILFWTRTTP